MMFIYQWFGWSEVQDQISVLPAQVSVLKQELPLLFFDVVETLKCGKRILSLIIEGDLSTLSEKVAAAAEERLLRIEAKQGRLYFRHIPRMRLGGVDPFERAAWSKIEMGPNYKTGNFYYLDAMQLVPKEKLFDKRVLDLGDWQVLCPAQTLRDYTRGGDAVLLINGEVVEWVNPDDAEIMLSDVLADEIFDAPRWLKKAGELFGSNKDLFQVLLQTVNQLVLNQMMFRAQHEFSQTYGVELFPEADLTRSVQIQTDAAFRRVILSLSGRMNRACTKNSGFVISCGEKEHFGYFHGVAVVNLSCGNAMVRLHTQVDRAVLEKYDCV